MIWKTYRYSPKSMRGLCTLGNEVGASIPVVGNVKGTRWLPHVQRASPDQKY